MIVIHNAGTENNRKKKLVYEIINQEVSQDADSYSSNESE